MDDDILGGLLSSALRQRDEREKENQFKSIDAAEKSLDEFLNQELDYKVGDYVVRNERGLKHYKLPNDNQAAKVVHIGELNFDADDSNGIDANVVIAVALGEDEHEYFKVDGRCYEKRGSMKNASFFKRGK